MGTREILIQARDLISDEQNWTRGCLARDIHGQPVPVANSKKAVCWCMMGAFEKVCGTRTNAFNEVSMVIYGILEKERLKTMSSFNDSHTHAEVIAVLDKAIDSL